jgi:hypothetical protein
MPAIGPASSCLVLQQQLSLADISGSGCMPSFSHPMINLYSKDRARAVAFYSEFGFVEFETFRTPASGRSLSSRAYFGVVSGGSKT